MRRMRSPPHSYKNRLKKMAKLHHNTRRPSQLIWTKKKYKSLSTSPHKTPLIAIQPLLFYTPRTSQAKQHWEECLWKQVHKKPKKRNKSGLDPTLFNKSIMATTKHIWNSFFFFYSHIEYCWKMSNKKRGCTHEHREYKKHTTRKHNTKKKKNTTDQTTTYPIVKKSGNWQYMWKSPMNFLLG